MIARRLTIHHVADYPLVGHLVGGSVAVNPSAVTVTCLAIAATLARVPLGAMSATRVAHRWEMTWTTSGRIVAPMAVADREQRAREAFARRRWGDAFADLSAAHREGRLDAEDLERLAAAAYMVGNDEACEKGWTAAHRAWLERGDAERAARCAFWQALGLFFRRRPGSRDGVGRRWGRLLKDGRHDGVAHAWFRMLTELPRLFQGDAGVDASFAEAGDIAERFADPDAAVFARMCRGYAVILQGRVDDGMKDDVGGTDLDLYVTGAADSGAAGATLNPSERVRSPTSKAGSRSRSIPTSSRIRTAPPTR